MQTESEPLFHSAHAAVRWALSDERVALQQSSLYRSPGSGRGLSGFDGVGQAGIIMSHVRKLELPRHPLIVAQCTAPKLPCTCRRECCSGWRSNPAWTAAVNAVAEWYVATHEPNCSRPRLIIACLRRFFGEHVNLETIGKRNGVAKATACEVNGEVLVPLKPLKEAAWARLDESLAASGIVMASTQSAAA